MKALNDIVGKLKIEDSKGDLNRKISSVCFDSRTVIQDSLFVATIGTHVNGHDYISKAIELGANAIVCQTIPENIDENITYIQVQNSADALGIISSLFYNEPSKKMKVVAITGTNGKTTTATLLHRLFRALGYNVGLLSTVQNQINEEIIPSTHTTPDAVSMNKLMAEMVKKNCTHCFIEASSHAIDQRRIAGLHITGAAFTNITHDHLDYHVTFDNYIAAKKKLFDDLPSTAFALVNTDDKRGMVMLQNCKAKKYTFSLKSGSDFKAKIISNTLQGLELEIDGLEVWFRLIGDFNAYNLVTIYAIAILLGEDKMAILEELSNIESADGRFQKIRSEKGIMAIVDYAHTPDALQNVLETISQLKENKKIITVVGCGGDRDKTKRPIMANIAAKLSNQVILTADNPRSEDPTTILAEMQQGVAITDLKKVLTIVDRKEAIKTACLFAEGGDIILLAGKGHETYQEIKGVKYPFDDKEVIKEMFNLLEI